MGELMHIMQQPSLTWTLCGPAWSWLLFVPSAKSSGLRPSSRTGRHHWSRLLGSTLQDDVWQVAPGVDWLLKKPWELCSRRWGARGANRSISTTPVRLQNIAGHQSAATTPRDKNSLHQHGSPPDAPQSQSSSDLLTNNINNQRRFEATMS